MPSPIVNAALIQGGFTVLAAGIAALTGRAIGKRFSDRKKLEKDLKIARNDIRYLLKVEEEHCRIHSNKSDHSLKNTVRKRVREQGYVWSEENTPSLITRKEGAD